MLHGRADPYFHARGVGDRVEIQGQETVFLGHRIPRSAPPDDGVFAEWAWDGQALSVSNDRYGMYPLYYFTGDEEVAVSPSIATLLSLGAPRDLDDDALEVFVRSGYLIGDDTPFRAIRSLPPRATLSWRAGAGSTMSSSFPSVKPQAISRAAAIDGYIWHFREAMARRPAPQSGAAVPLSGGRDSRHILLELVTSGRPPRLCVTTRHIPPRDDADLAVATRLTDRLGLPHVVLRQPPSQLRAEVRKNVLTGFCAEAHAWYLPVADYLGDRVECIYDGLAGGTLSGGTGMTPGRQQLFEAARYEEFAGQLLRTRARQVRSFLTPTARRRLGQERALAHLTEEVRRHGGATSPIGSFRFWNRIRREIALQTLRLLPRSVTVFQPYLDHDLFDFLTSLPADLLVDRTFHTETILAAYPDHADIPFLVKGGRVVDRGHTRRVGRETALFAARHGTGRLIDRRRIAPRLLRTSLFGDHSVTDALRIPMVIDLLQIEEVADGHGPPIPAAAG